MKKFKILVAIDFSKDSFSVLQKALEFAKSKSGVVDILHVVENSFFSLKKDLSYIRKNGFKKLQETFFDIQEENFHCIEGKVKSEVAKAAAILNSDLIIIGKSGERYMLGDFIMGSHTKDIVRSSPAPVIVVKSNHELKYENILILSDFSQASAKAIKKVAETFSYSNITILNFYLLPFENRLGTYGFNPEDIIEYQRALKDESEREMEKFLNSLELPKEVNVSGKVRRSSLNPKLFKDEVAGISFDLLAIHTTGNISFYAIDILENSQTDVFILKEA